MKTAVVLKLLLLNIVSVVVLTASGQTRLVLNGAHIVITTNAALVIANDAPNAITRFGGGIVSEGEGNRVQWMIGQTIGTYTLPWNKGTTYFPLTFTKSAGTGLGNFLFSTFPTPPQNSLNLPSGVTDLNRGGTDKSLFFIDRFWQLNAHGYTSKPSLTNVQFGYIDDEHVLPNTIVESVLSALRWNDDTKTWNGFTPAGVANANSNTVAIANISNTDLYKWWSLMGQDSALPVHFLSFVAKREGKTAQLLWKTADETDIRDFEVQKSVDGNRFISIARTPAKGGSGPNAYVHTDIAPVQGQNFYRIKEIGKDGSYRFSVTRSVVMNNDVEFDIYPNPVVGPSFTINATGLPIGSYTVQLNAQDGKLVSSFIKVFSGGYVPIDLRETLSKGIYVLKLTSVENTFSTQIFITGY